MKSGKYNLGYFWSKLLWTWARRLFQKTVLHPQSLKNVRQIKLVRPDIWKFIFYNICSEKLTSKRKYRELYTYLTTKNEDMWNPKTQNLNTS